MVIITYANFKEVQCKYVKYTSKVGDKFMLRIIDFLEFRTKLLNKFTEEEIKWFFGIFPHSLDSDISEVDKIISIKLAIEFYEDLHLTELYGKEYVLFDESSEYFKYWEFPKFITAQPIPFDNFFSIAFDDFVLGSTLNLIFGIEDNLEQRNEKRKKYVERNDIREGVYI
ncbi:MAG: hypothetical protein ACFFDF_25855 [Candidatus Odinarchaeota archaeon]